MIVVYENLYGLSFASVCDFGILLFCSHDFNCSVTSMQYFSAYLPDKKLRATSLRAIIC